MYLTFCRQVIRLLAAAVVGRSFQRSAKQYAPRLKHAGINARSSEWAAGAVLRLRAGRAGWHKGSALPFARKSEDGGL